MRYVVDLTKAMGRRAHRFILQKSPYIGPRGGLWEDPQHTRHWNPQKHQEVAPKFVSEDLIPRDQLELIVAKLTKLSSTALKKVRAEIAKMKNLYVKHNELMEELMPLFIEVQADQFIIKREIKIGSTKYRFNPFFYDEKKGTVVPKVWKSTAFESGSIE